MSSEVWCCGALLGGVEEDAHCGGHALASVAKTDDFEAMHVLVDLALAHDHEFGEAFVHLFDAAASKDGEGFAGRRVRGEASLLALAEGAFLDVEVVVELFLAPGLGVHDVLEVRHAEGEVAALILGGEAEDLLLGVVLGDEFAHAEERLHEAFADEVEEGGHFREVIDAEEVDGAEARIDHAAAVDEGALAEDVEVTAFVHDLGAEEELGFEVIRVDLLHEAAGEVAAPRLLLLRVFSLGARSGRLFDGFARLWRHLGSVRMIAGPDLANETVEPYEFLDFLAGRLQRRFITNARVLQQRLAESAAKRDPDGRFRVSSFFCHADTWQMVLRRLARESDVVLMDLRGFTRTNKGCVYELHALLEIVRLEQFVLVVDGTTDEGFLAEVLGQGWANISAISRNRTAPAPRVRIYRLDGSGAVGIDKLVATVASAHAGGLFPEAT